MLNMEGRKVINMKIDQNRLFNFVNLFGFCITLVVVINNTIKEVGIFQQILLILVLAYFCYVLVGTRFRSD